MKAKVLKTKSSESQQKMPQIGRLDNLAKARTMKNIQNKFLKPSYPKGHKFSNEEKTDILHIYYSNSKGV